MGAKKTASPGILPPQPATCVCCGATWYPTKESPKVSLLRFRKGPGPKGEVRDFHARCHEFVDEECRAAVERASKRA